MAHVGTKRRLEDEFAAVAHSPSKRARTLSTPVRPVQPLHRQHRVQKSGHRRFRPYEGHNRAQTTTRKELDFSAADSSSDSDRGEDASDSDEVVIVRPRAKDMRIAVDDVLPKKIKREPSPVAAPKRVLRQDIDELILSKANVDKLIEDAMEELATLRHMVRRLAPESPTGSIFGLSAEKTYRAVGHSLGAARKSFLKVHDATVDFQFKQCVRYSLEGLDLGGSILPLRAFPLKKD